jgi:hypothetical protein
MKYNGLFAEGHEQNIVTDFINALPGNSFVNTNTGNNKRKTVFSMRSAPGWGTEL